VKLLSGSPRGLPLTYEAVRYWCQKCGQVYANALRCRRPRPSDTWHLDEVFLAINEQRQYLWRAVDQDGHILDILVQRRRDRKAAKKCFRKLLKRLIYVPRVLMTDKLESYGAAKRELLSTSSIGHIGISAIVPRIPTNRRASASDVWADATP